MVSILVCVDVSCLPCSMLSELDTVAKKMDEHYNTLAASMARHRCTPKPSEELPGTVLNPTATIWLAWHLRLLKEIQAKLEVSEILLLALPFIYGVLGALRGANATRAEAHAQSLTQPFLAQFSCLRGHF